jgi:hypothetical protein
MAIVQISKIQHRRGLKENLPNLGSAELAWALDTRQLYIGNGALTEGAPTVGRTEILTEYSDILGLFASYTYTGEAATAYSVQTGPSSASPVTRSVQARLDEFVSVKSFGAKGDGVTDDTVAINRALYQLYCVEQITSVRRSLYFPAGVYLISDTVKVPAFANVYGDGKNSTILRCIDDVDVILKLADSLQQVDANIGNNSAVRPQYISMSDMAFEVMEDNSIFEITAAEKITFSNVAFRGSLVDPSDAGNSKYALALYSTPVLLTKDISFRNCDFTGTTYGIISDDDMSHIVFDDCKFGQLYRGFKLGENTTGSGSSINGPTNVIITKSLFDEIANIAIYVYTDITGVYSINNRFTEVGNAYAGEGGNAVSPIIKIEGNYNYSIGDQFNRDELDELDYPKVDFGNYSVTVDYPGEHISGSLRQKTGGAVTLTDNTSVAASTGVVINTTTTPAVFVDYVISRDSIYRVGTMKIAHTGSGQSLDDEFTESDGDVGVAFSLTNAGSSTIIKYTTTNSGNNATFKYAIRYLI